ncbi:MAG: energy transducer TonB [Nibricoccus sp.]
MNTSPSRALASLLILAGLPFAGCQSQQQSPTSSDSLISNVPRTGNFISADDADKKPRAIKTVQPIFPFELKRRGISGEVMLEFIVDTDGKPSQIRVVRYTAKGFIAPAIQSLEQWRFKAALKNGQPVACLMQTPFIFTVADKL